MLNALKLMLSVDLDPKSRGLINQVDSGPENVDPSANSMKLG